MTQETNLPPQAEPSQAAQAEATGRCSNCDDTGHVSSITGEYHGRCHCEAGRDAPPMFAAEATKAVADGVQWAADRYNWLREHSFVQSAYGQPRAIHFGAGFNQTRPALLDLAIDDQRKLATPAAPAGAVPVGAGIDWYEKHKDECTKDFGEYDENAPVATRLRWWVPKSARHGRLLLEDDLLEAVEALTHPSAPQASVPDGSLSDEMRLSLLNKLARHRGFENAAKALASLPLATAQQPSGFASSDRPSLPDLPPGLPDEVRVLMTRYAMHAVDEAIRGRGELRGGFAPQENQAATAHQVAQPASEDTAMLEADAARYRWLREQIQAGPLTIAECNEWEILGWCGDNPDGKIDAAMTPASSGAGDGGQQ